MSTTMQVTAPPAPGRLGEAILAPELLTYLAALEEWLSARRAELDQLDAAARGGADPAAFVDDVVLAMGLWQSARARADELAALWDSGRADEMARDRMSRLVWGRLETGAGALSLVEVARLCDALVDHLRERLAFDPDDEALTARRRAVRAALVRCEDLAQGDPAAVGRVADLVARLGRVAAQAARGADVSGPLTDLEAQVSRAERDLIVAAAGRAQLARDRERARAQVDELVQRRPALVDLAARCRREVLAPPRLALPVVERLGPVPQGRVELDEYLARLDAVARATRAAQEAYTAPLRERAGLRYRIQAAWAEASRRGRDGSPTVRAARDEAHDAVEAQPCDVRRAAALVDQLEYLTEGHIP